LAARRKAEAVKADEGGEDLADADYRALAGFRCELRKFMAFSARSAKLAGLEPQQYQAMLAIRARPADEPMSTSTLAEELFISVSTTVELLDRLEVAGLVVRRQSATDRRRTEVMLTPKARRILKSLAATHRDEIRQHVPALVALLSQIGRRTD
jgi:DNA-binding MarR family transcriptional regulator